MTHAHTEALGRLARYRNTSEERILEQLIERAYGNPDAYLDWRPGDRRRTEGPDPFHPADGECTKLTATTV